ncbi:hypothetical protein SAY86_000746 [Trapa natans]|uniref:Uncharacterized protein n=1 Tax=Trapa natans TaxID=22666 RepID=A0AAN7M4H8_TRANT|nr:hypothetical protein SAY86_000746 [Trapa natans]
MLLACSMTFCMYKCEACQETSCFSLKYPHNKPNLIKVFIPELLPFLYTLAIVKHELIISVDVSPFKHINALLLFWPLLLFLQLTQVSHLFSLRLFGGSSAEDNHFKPKKDAVKQEVNRSQGRMRSTLRATAFLNWIRSNLLVLRRSRIIRFIMDFYSQVLQFELYYVNACKPVLMPLIELESKSTCLKEKVEVPIVFISPPITVHFEEPMWEELHIVIRRSHNVGVVG